MGLFEQFPYANYHELNLDWLLQIVKQLDNKVDNIDGEIAEYLQQLIDSGELADIIDDVLLNRKLSVYDTFADIPEAELSDGDIVMTRGFYAKGDAGAGLYQVAAGAYPEKNGVGFAILGDATPLKCGAPSDGISDSYIYIAGLFSHYLNIKLDPIVFVTSAALTVRTNHHIKGYGATLTAPAGSGFNMLTGSGLSGVIIEGLRIVGPSVPSGPFKMINLPTGDGNTIKNCQFENGYGYAIRLGGSVDCKVEGCAFIDITGVSGDPGGCIYLQGGSHCVFNDIIANRIQDHVVYLDGSVETYDISCRDIIQNNVTAPLTNAACVVCYGNVHDVTIDHCGVKNGRVAFNIAPRDGAEGHNITIRDCFAYSCTENFALIVGLKSAYMNVNIVNAYGSVLGQDGVSIRDALGVHILNSCFLGVVRYGVAVSNAERCTVKGCKTSGGNAGIIHGWPNNATDNTFEDCSSSDAVTDIYDRSGGARFINCVGGTVTMTIDSAVVNNKRSIEYGTTAPAAGWHNAGDVCFDTSGASTGWRCTAAGAPGTWAAI